MGICGLGLFVKCENENEIKMSILLNKSELSFLFVILLRVLFLSSD